MELEPCEAEDDFVYGCRDDEDGKAFLVLGSNGEGEWCCDMRNSAGPKWSYIQGLGLEKERRVGMKLKFSEEVWAWSIKFPHGTGVH